MHDPVADVLQQRAALDRGAGAGLALSLLLHAGLAAAVVYGALHREPPQTAGVINIRFAQVPARPITPASSAPRPAPRIEEPKPVVESKKPPDKPAEKNTVPLSPFGRSTKKGSENPPAPEPKAAPPATGTAAAAAEVPVGEAGVTGLEGGDFPYTFYIERMKNLIGTRWVRPPVPDGTTTTVHFVIQRDGRIQNVRTEIPSGHGGFDRNAYRAVLESSPLPPLPFGYSGNHLGVHLTFK